MVRAASKGHGKVGNAVGEKHGEKRVQRATGEVVVGGTRREVVRARLQGAQRKSTVLSQVELCLFFSAKSRNIPTCCLLPLRLAPAQLASTPLVCFLFLFF